MTGASWTRGRSFLVFAVLLLTAAACESSEPPSSRSGAVSTSSGSSTSSSTGTPATSTTSPPSAPCHGAVAPVRYQHVVVVMMENRTWSQQGGPGFGSMPYLKSLAQQCAFYALWTNTNANQSSLTQYIGLTSGVNNPHTVDDCSPSAACSSQDDNIFRQVRQSGGSPRTYVEGATSPCSAAGNAAKHVPALYYRGTYRDATGTRNDADFCTSEVRPASEFDPDNLPTFAMFIPTLCNDGHDCGNATVDEWASVHIAAILAGNDYRAGTTAVFVLWDERDPVPNLLVAPSALSGPRPGAGSHASALKTIEEILDLPVLQQGQLPTAGDLRASAPI